MGCGSSPTLPDYAQQSRDAILAQLQTYPMTYKVNAAASLGIPVTINGQPYDFSQSGDAQTASVVSDQMAQALLAIQQNYGADFIKQRLAELQTADPQGYAARQDLFNKILAQANEQPNRPLATNLQNQIQQTLNKAGQLDARQLQEVQQGVRGGQAARGNYLGNAATSQEASAAVSAADQSRSAAQQQALSMLQAGVSPQDVAYRRMQQSLSNLSNFVQGQTPTAEFGSLSGAGNAAAPFTTMSQNTAAINPNASALGGQNALAIYGGQVNWAQNQINPYTAGLSSGINSLNAATSLGWQPWGTQASNPGYYGGASLSPALVAQGQISPDWNPGQTGP